MKNLVIALFAFVVASCSGDSTGTGEPASNLPAKDISNVSYGNHTQQKYDIYLPAQRSTSTTKVFIFIHGGGWVGGDKADINSGIPIMKQTYFPKYAIVNMNYVLGNAFAPGYALPNQIDDIQAVIDDIKDKSKEYQIKPEFVLCGNSAGAHLSMFYAFKQKNPEIKAVVNIVGPADFNLPSWQSNPLNGLFGNLVNPAVVPPGLSVATYASPAYWVTSLAPPTISFYGSADTAVNATENKTSLDAKLSYSGVAHESYIYNGDHNAWAVEPQLSWILEMTKDFLNTHNP